MREHCCDGCDGLSAAGDSRVVQVWGVTNALEPQLRWRQGNLGEHRSLENCLRCSCFCIDEHRSSTDAVTHHGQLRNSPSANNMTGLVAYDSSSDEDTEPQPVVESKNPPQDAVPIHNSESGPADRPIGSTTTTDREAALVGPVMPTEMLDSSLAEDVSVLDDVPDTMSEQDLVRHLTQASHPMTTIPPSPPGSPDPATDVKFKRFLNLKAQGLHFNEDLAKKPSFRNPALLSTLLERAGLSDEAHYATSLPASVYDPGTLPTYAYKEELARRQQSIRDQQAARKKQASAAGKRIIDFAPGGGSATSSQTSTPGSQRKGFGS